MTALKQARIGKPQIITTIRGDERIRRFLCSLGCFEGEQVTVVSMLSDNYIISVKDSRFAIDSQMAGMIEVQERSQGSN